MNHCPCGATASIEPPLPLPFSVQLAEEADEAHRFSVFDLAFAYADDFVELMVVDAAAGSPTGHTPAQVLRNELSDLATVPALARGAIIAELARITEFALFHNYGMTQMRDFECALGIAYSASIAEPHDLPPMRTWFAEVAWEAANNPIDGLAGRPIRDATVDETRVAFASAWSAVMNLLDPAHAMCRYRAYLEDRVAAAGPGSSVEPSTSSQQIDVDRSARCGGSAEAE